MRWPTALHVKAITRFMLVWFALSLGAAVASPLLHAKNTELICSGAGVMKIIVHNDDGSTEESTAPMLDCPLCGSVSAPPPPTPSLSVESPQPLSHALQPIAAAHIAARIAAPLPARGPPLLA